MVDYFQKIPLFADVSQTGLELLHQYAQVQKVPADTWLFHQHDRGDACYIVVSGTIRLLVEHGSTEETTLGLLGPQAFFGELSLLEPDGTRAAGALAVMESEVIKIPVHAFDSLMQSHPQLAMNVLRKVATHLRRSDERRLESLRQKNRLLTEAYTALEQAQAEALRRARAARELELGRELQRRLLPTSFPQVPGLQIAAASFPAYEMSGDFYDVRLDAEQTLEIIMADVCDKGAGAALLMALTKGLLLDTQQQTPLTIIERVNHKVRTTSLEAAVITLVYAQLNPDTHSLTYVRAGHDWPIHFRAITGQVGLLEGGGMPIGISDEPFFEQVEVAFGIGDALILYTDGLCDARNNAGDSYGRERLIAAVSAYGHLAAQGLAEALLGDVRSFQNGTPPLDDLTLLVIKLAA